MTAVPALMGRASDEAQLREFERDLLCAMSTARPACRDNQRINILNTLPGQIALRLRRLQRWDLRANRNSANFRGLYASGP